MNPKTGFISYRGILALAIGLLFLWFSFHPEAFNDDVPPFFILVIMFLSGALMVYGGLASLRFVWKRAALVKSSNPVNAEICVLMDNDSDRETETVHVRFKGACQALGVDRSGAVTSYTDGKIRIGQVWLDEKGKAHAVSLDGRHFNTLIGGTHMTTEKFGKN